VSIFCGESDRDDRVTVRKRGRGCLFSHRRHHGLPCVVHGSIFLAVFLFKVVVCVVSGVDHVKGFAALPDTSLDLSQESYHDDKFARPRHHGVSTDFD
jgi:hypothetical protein